MIIKLIIISIILLGIAFAGIAVKMFFIKGFEFRKTCGSVDPSAGTKTDCTCGSEASASCSNK